MSKMMTPEQMTHFFTSDMDRIKDLQAKLAEADQWKAAAMAEGEANEKLQAENAKLRECVKFYAKEGNWDDRILLILDDTEDTAYSSYNGGKRARQVLRELDEKL